MWGPGWTGYKLSRILWRKILLKRADVCALVATCIPLLMHAPAGTQRAAEAPRTDRLSLETFLEIENRRGSAALA